MSYELYTKAGACSMAIHAVMIELGLNPKIHLLEAGAGPNGLKSPDYLKINPRGNVPYVIEDGKGIAEGGAILAYLSDKYSKLLPKDGYERAQALQWLMFANSTLHPAYSRTFWISANVPKDAQEATLKTARTQIQDLWDYVEKKLEQSGGEYVCGKNITAADFLISTIANWNAQAYKFGPKTKALFKAVSERPSFQKALSAESIEYKAAA